MLCRRCGEMAMVLVTGGSRGIGRACCTAFAQAGWDVAFCYDKDEAGAEETRRLVSERGAGVLALRCDVRSEEQVERMFAALSGVSVLVNNAGVALFAQIQNTTLAQWREVFSVNTEGAFLCTRAAIPRFLRRGGGCIVNVSSVWGEAGASCESAYSASKAALIGFTKAAAKELAPSGIRVNCVACGMADTQMNARLSEQERQAFLQNVPAGRQAAPEEVAAAVLFLAQSRYITGEVLRVNGGLYM